MEETLHLNQDIKYLIHEDIIKAYELGYHEFGSNRNKVCDSCVEKRVVEPQTHFFGVEQYPGLFKKAAVYMYRITTSHCFEDGNKRAAILSTDLFLKYNGFEFKVSHDELYDFVYAVADHETRPTLEEVEEWIQLNVQPYTLNQEELSEFL